MEIYYSTNDIIDEFNNEDNKMKIEILGEAIEFMKQYNGRSKTDCIALAMGYALEWDNNNNCQGYVREENIKPCPFCGSEANTAEYTFSNEKCYRVECENGHKLDSLCDSEKEAIEEWNQRG